MSHEIWPLSALYSLFCFSLIQYKGGKMLPATTESGDREHFCMGGGYNAASGLISRDITKKVLSLKFTFPDNDNLIINITNVYFRFNSNYINPFKETLISEYNIKFDLNKKRHLYFCERKTFRLDNIQFHLFPWRTIHNGSG